MNQIVTLTGFETKTGANDSGDWTLYLFKDAGGNKYQTFDDDLGPAAVALIGKSVEVEYEVQERDLPAKGDRPATTVRNNVIKSVKEAAGSIGEPQQTPGATVQYVNDRSQFQRSKEEVRRTEAVKAAAAIISGPAWTGGTEPSDLFELAAQIAVYNEQGAEAFAESVQF